MRAAAIGVAATALGSAVLGCGASTSTRTVSADKAEALVREMASRQAGVRVRRASCPDDVEAEVGTRFTCTVTGRDGTAAEVGGRVTSAEEGGRIFVGAPLLHSRDAERTIRRALRRQVGPTVRVACPEVVRLRAGTRFVCRASAAEGRRARIEVTAKNAGGSIRYRVVPLPG